MNDQFNNASRCLIAATRLRGQAHCRWCRRRPGLNGCPVTSKQRGALLAWFAARGRNWKSDLSRAWESGDYGSFPQAAELQQLRNALGPRWLQKITSSFLTRRLLRNQ